MESCTFQLIARILRDGSIRYFMLYLYTEAGWVRSGRPSVEALGFWICLVLFRVTSVLEVGEKRRTCTLDLLSLMLVVVAFKALL